MLKIECANLPKGKLMTTYLVTLHLGQVHSLLDGVPEVTGLHLEGTL